MNDDFEYTKISDTEQEQQHINISLPGRSIAKMVSTVCTTIVLSALIVCAYLSDKLKEVLLAMIPLGILATFIVILYLCFSAEDCEE